MREVLEHLNKSIHHLNEAHRVFPPLFQGHERASALALVVNARQTTEYAVKKLLADSIPESKHDA